MRLEKVSHLCTVILNGSNYGTRQENIQQQQAKVRRGVIGDSEAKEMRVAANGRPSRSPYLKLVYPNGVTLILPADTSVEQLRAYIGITV